MLIPPIQVLKDNSLPQTYELGEFNIKTMGVNAHYLLALRVSR